ncbi:unnamed protein product [Effrenium voratum]|nr:unnamed protein product [Effrenium voratum]
MSKVTSSIKALGKRRLWQAALAILQDLAETKTQTDLRHVTAAMSACEKASEWRAVLSLAAESAVCADARATGAALLSLARAARWRQALDLLRESPVDLLGYIAAMNACTRASRWRYALELLQDARSAGHSPDIKTYTTAAVAARRGTWPLAFEVLAEALAEGLQVDTAFFNSLLGVCLDAEGTPGAWVAALQLLAEMGKMQCPADAVSFATCARTCERTLQWEQALALFEVARAGQTSISGLLNAVSGASGRAGRWEDAMSWLQVACEQRLDNVVTYNTAANACVKAARWSKALDIFSRTPAPNAASFTTALHACEDHWEDALGLLADMTAAALQPELADFRTYARALGRARHWQQVRSSQIDEDPFGVWWHGPARRRESVALWFHVGCTWAPGKSWSCWRTSSTWRPEGASTQR